MKLEDVIRRLDEFDDALTIYAAKDPDWSRSSRAVVARAQEDGSLPPEAKGLAYVLQVDAAKEAVEVSSEWRNGATPTLDQKLEAVLHYAVYDAYLS